jgi:hypothetical protein
MTNDRLQMTNRSAFGRDRSVWWGVTRVIIQRRFLRDWTDLRILLAL